MGHKIKTRIHHLLPKDFHGQLIYSAHVTFLIKTYQAER